MSLLKGSDSSLHRAYPFPTSGIMNGLPSCGPERPSDPLGEGTETWASPERLDRGRQE